jgi:hypothetical protein
MAFLIGFSVDKYLADIFSESYEQFGGLCFDLTDERFNKIVMSPAIHIET